MKKLITILFLMAGIAAANETVLLGNLSDITWAGSGLNKVASFGSAFSPLDLSPIAWYKGDNTAIDSMGLYNGSWYGGAVYTNGINGSAMQFVGTNYVSVADNVALRPNQLTVCAWIKRNGAQAASAAAIGKHLNYKLQYSNTDKITYVLYPNGSASTLYNEPIDNAWHHITMTYNGTNGVAYIDGSLVGTNTISGANDAGTSALGIGYDSYSTARIFIGLVDDVMIFNRALTGTEIAQIYAWRE